MHDHQHAHRAHHSDPGGWDFNCIEEQDENAVDEMMMASPSSQREAVGPYASMDAPQQSFLTSTCDDQDGDDCVFNLEL